ncbi:MAG: DUF523 domain-containing protein [Sulfurimonas sp.]|jgi:uncharacterized protein YbbK (DUF523 family)|nr:DUF523 domain-containing protein [Sulfurimonas sp.]
MSKEKVIISACLLGHTCRYDGQTKKTTEIVDAFSEYDIIPFCPEAPLFGTPRERISVIEIDGKNHIVTDKTNKDVTKLLEDEINTFIDKNKDINKIVLKSKSPSCGYKTTPILNENKETIKTGNGIATELFLKEFKDISISDEFNY